MAEDKRAFSAELIYGSKHLTPRILRQSIQQSLQGAGTFQDEICSNGRLDRRRARHGVLLSYQTREARLNRELHTYMLLVIRVNKLYCSRRERLVSL